MVISSEAVGPFDPQVLSRGWDRGSRLHLVDKVHPQGVLTHHAPELLRSSDVCTCAFPCGIPPSRCLFRGPAFPLHNPVSKASFHLHCGHMGRRPSSHQNKPKKALLHDPNVSSYASLRSVKPTHADTLSPHVRAASPLSSSATRSLLHPPGLEPVPSQ